MMGCLCVKLNEVKLGQQACIREVSGEHRLTKRLVELGFYSKALVTPVFSSLIKGSRAYNICDSIVALRDAVAENIEVTLITGGRYEE